VTDLRVPDSYNLVELFEAVVDRVQDRVAVTCADVHRTYAELDERANRLANWLSAAGVGAGDHVGIYLTNGPEYLEAMFASFKIGAVPVNINFRYVAAELRDLFTRGELVAVVHGVEYAQRVDEVWDDCPLLRVRTSVGDDHEANLASAAATRPGGVRSGDEHYMIYTGGTTGMPKGVVWRQEDAFFACIGGGDPMRMSGPVTSPAEVVERIIDFDFVAFPLAPLMHAAAQWTGLSWLYCGARLVLQPGSFDALAVWRTIETEKVSTLIIVGDAMARPLLDVWDTEGPFDVSSMFAVGSGGAPLSPVLKERLIAALPGCTITDGFGSSETGAQGGQRLEPGVRTDGLTRFTRLGEGTTVLDDDLNEVQPGSGVVGRVALTGRIPLGYHGDPEATAEAFVEHDGRRWVVTGDAATVEEDGSITLFGRGSTSINTGGEKVFPEEVEGALKAHPSVFDCIVVGVPDERFGQAVAAVVAATPGHSPDLATLAEHCKSLVAGYKVPRSLVVVDAIVRSPAGKPDVRWAKDLAISALPS